MPSAASRSSSAIASSTSGMPGRHGQPGERRPGPPRAEQQRVARDVQLPQVAVEQQRVEHDLAAGLEQLRELGDAQLERPPVRLPAAGQLGHVAGVGGRGDDRRVDRRRRHPGEDHRRAAGRPRVARVEVAAPAGERDDPRRERAYVDVAPGRRRARRRQHPPALGRGERERARSPLPRRFSAVSRATSVPGPRSSTQSAPSARDLRARPRPSAPGSTNCARAGIAAGAEHRRPAWLGDGRATPRTRASGSASAGEWNGTSTAQRRPRRSAAARRRAGRPRSAASRAACAASRARSASSARRRAGDDEPRARALTSAHDDAARPSARRLQPRERDAVDRGHRRAPARRRGHVQALDRGALAGGARAARRRRRRRAPRRRAAPPAGPASGRRARRPSPRRSRRASTSAHSARHSSAWASRLSG